MAAELRVLPTLTIRSGESISPRVFLGSYVCGFESYLCRRVVVEASPGELIDLEVMAVEGQQAGLGTYNPPIPFLYQREMTVSGGDVWIYPGGAKDSAVRGVFEQEVTLTARRH